MLLRSFGLVGRPCFNKAREVTSETETTSRRMVVVPSSGFPIFLSPDAYSSGKSNRRGRALFAWFLDALSSHRCKSQPDFRHLLIGWLLWVDDGRAEGAARNTEQRRNRGSAYGRVDFGRSGLAEERRGSVMDVATSCLVANRFPL